MPDVAAVITRTHREEWARIVAGLTRRFGDLDLAEEMTADAFATAVENWPVHGVPPNPAGWVTTTANRRAIDLLRREARRDDKHREALMLQDPEPAAPTGVVEDDRLRLLFICCHPALSLEARVALTLRIVGGLTVPEIAHAFLAQDTTMGQRITRAKAKIKAASIPFTIPRQEDLPARVDAVLTVLYLVFNEGYLASGPDAPPIRRELTAEAIRLTRLTRELLPDDAEVAGLLALMLLTEARSQTRVSADGELVRLDEQDRGAWDRTLISEGLQLLGSQVDVDGTGTRPGRYQLLAAINAVHIAAPHARDTDWARIVNLYTRLEEVDPSPIVTLNKAIAVSEHDSPDVALAIVERLTDTLGSYHAFHVTRAELLRATGRSADARAAYDRAIDLAGNTAETAHLIRRRNQLATPNGERS
ncbi:RNA polymerase sigma factor [Microbacterium sp. GCM10011525]|uniref:RNA polymerase sigma factor n=1 Tax=unclassified Microbacterium TaxID=2609290 RepID=UPI0012F7232A|nr:RNA polymerase sigma factor [Microbacterium sp. MAH-37]MVQ43109.1 RNA polymerase sigma factor [Microbacterium sp. MAH-37]